MMAILVFSVWTNGFLPNNGAFDIANTPSWDVGYAADVFRHAVLPGLTLMVTSIGGWTLIMRNNIITTLAEDYVRMGRAKGLSNRRIMYRYAARNALLPSLTGFAMSLGFVISGAILIEYVFNYPGVGYMLLNAVNNLDYPLMQALFLMITVAVLVAVLLCDVLTAVLDPRTRAKS
jgi:peptide/nickel transport system permease protein